MILGNVVEGQTSRIEFPPLTEDDEVIDGTGLTVSDLLITGNDDTAVDTTGDFGWASAPAGTVYYDPDAADFDPAKSPYRVRVKLTDGAGKVRYYPNGAPAELVVRPVK